MATIAQIFANRQNAPKSTGPQTDKGKSAVSQNEVKHGLFAESVIKGENEADYEAFHDNFLAEFAPAGAVELMLAERVVNLAWRLKRAERMQNQVIDDMRENYITNPLARRMHVLATQAQGVPLGDPRCTDRHLPLGRVARLDWSSSKVLERMMIYEKRIESSLHKTMDELKKYQIMRRIEYQDADEQYLHAQTIPKAFGFEAATQSMRAYPSLRDEAATQQVEKKVDLKKQSQSRPSAGNPKPGYLNPKQVEKDAILKKQSQFVPGLSNATSYLKGDYDKIPAGGGEENKAKQSQLHNPVLTEEAVKSEKQPASSAV